MVKSKTCTKCGKRKLLSAFHKDKQRKDGVRSRCKKCIKVCTLAYNQIHKAKTLEYARKYRQIHKVKIAKDGKKYRKTYNAHTRYGKKYKNTFGGCLRARFNQMKQRCNNSKNTRYKDYGGRGIKCLFRDANEFINYVVNILELNTVGEIKKLTIDRIDNDGNYEPGNIRFVTQAENNKNRKRK